LYCVHLLPYATPATASDPLSYTTLFRSQHALDRVGHEAAREDHVVHPMRSKPVEHEREEGPPGERHDRLRDRQRERPQAGPLPRSEEHTSELQSRVDLVCRLLLEKKKHA